MYSINLWGTEVCKIWSRKSKDQVTLHGVVCHIHNDTLLDLSDQEKISFISIKRGGGHKTYYSPENLILI